jgi:hypothetical protein
MKLLRNVPEAVMVAAFLKAEFFSPRFSADLRETMRSFSAEEVVITHPDITDVTENELRARLLGEHRGYQQDREMFDGVPGSLSWYEAELARQEIGNLRYVDYSYWNELTDNTHLVRDGVKNIQKGRIVFGVAHDRFWAVTERIVHNEQSFEPIVLWGQDSDSPLEILEGHLRATAFGLAGDLAPDAIPVIVGLINAAG